MKSTKVRTILRMYTRVYQYHLSVANAKSESISPIYTNMDNKMSNTAKTIAKFIGP